MRLFLLVFVSVVNIGNTDEDTGETDIPQPDSKPRFRQKTENDGKLFSSEIEEFSYDGKTIDNGIVYVEAHQSTTQTFYQLNLRNVIGKALFTGYIKKKSEVKDGSRCSNTSKSIFDPKKAQASLTVIFKKDEKFQKCKCLLTFGSSTKKDDFVKVTSNIISKLQDPSPAKETVPEEKPAQETS